MIIYEALYCSNTEESDYRTLSIHASKKGAQKAIKEHKKEKLVEIKKFLKDFKDKNPKFKSETFTLKGQLEKYDWSIAVSVLRD
jgi:patatin-like phospholipase/acyl hydrolase